VVNNVEVMEIVVSVARQVVHYRVNDIHLSICACHSSD